MTHSNNRASSTEAGAGFVSEGVTAADADVYHVVFGANDVRKMSLDQVDDCFRLGVISERTLLWTAGMDAWETLGDAAGLSEQAHTPPPAPRQKPSKPARAASPTKPTTSVRPPPPSRRKNATSGERPVHAGERAAQTGERQTGGRAVQLPPPPSAPVSVRSEQVPSQAPAAAGRNASSVGQIRVLPSAHGPSGAHASPSHPAQSYPAQSYPAQSYPAQSYPASTVQQSYTQHSAPSHPAPGLTSSPPMHAAPVTHAMATRNPYIQPLTPYKGPAPAAASPAAGVQTAAMAYAAIGYPVGAIHAGHAVPAGLQSQVSAQPYSGSVAYAQAPMYQPSSYSEMPPAHSMVAPAMRPQATPSAPSNVAPWNNPSSWNGATSANRPAPWASSATSLVPSVSDISVSGDPFRSRASWSTRVQRSVFAMCVLGGAVTIAYRNDGVLQLARASHNESLFLSLEKRWFGGAPNGIPRQVKALLGIKQSSVADIGLTPAPEGMPTIRLGALPPVATAKPVGEEPGTKELASDDTSAVRTSAVAVATTPDAPAAHASSGASSGVSIHSTRASGRSTVTSSGITPRALRSTTSTTSSDSDSRFSSSSREETSSGSSLVPRRSAAEIAEMKRRHWDKATARSQASDKEEQPSRARPEREAKPEPTPTPGTNDFLHMSMRQSVKDAKVKGKANKSKLDKSGSKEYDPLNGEI